MSSPVHYSQGVAPFYDLFEDEPGQDPASLAFVKNRLPAGASVLEVGAGLGTLAMGLAAEGFQVTALEPDREMYAALLARLALHPELKASLTPLPQAAGVALGRRFDAMLCLAVFHLLNAREQHALLDHAAQHLEPGGVLILDVAVEGTERQERTRYLAGERQLGDLLIRKHVTMRRSSHSTAQARWLTTWDIESTRGPTVVNTVRRTFDWQPSVPVDVEAMLVQRGWQIEGRYADRSGAPYVLGQSRSLLFVARFAAKTAAG